MTRIEYELLREEEPQLRLPKWFALWAEDYERLKTHTRETLMAARTAKLLGREYVTDGR